MICCITPTAKAANADLIIKDIGGSPSRLFRLARDEELLKLHIDLPHEIVGSFTTASGPSATIPTLTVEKLKWLALRCRESQDATAK